MSSRSFYLYQRKNGIYYAEFLSPCGTRKLYRSTRSKNRDEAAAIVGRWLTEGVPIINGKVKKTLKEAVDFQSMMRFIEKGDITEEQANKIAVTLKSRELLFFKVSTAVYGKQKFIEFLYNFWDYNNSPYLRDKKAKGKSISLRTCKDVKWVIQKDWQPYFGNKLLSDITRNDLKEFGFSLRDRLSGKSVNNRLHVGTTALKWAYREKMIPENITEGLGGFAGGGKKRDILTDAEIEKLNNIQYWDNKKAYAAFRLASTSALRNGECRALKREDIGEGIIYIRHGYNHFDGLKAPKNNEERTVYLLPEVRTLIMELLTEHPVNHDRQFVFSSEIDPEKPCGAAHFVKWLHRAIAKAGIELAGRRIDFHSLRHFVAT